MFFTMATEIEKFVALGKEIGLEGDELRSFVKEQQDLVREERFRAREAEKEQLERQAQLQKEAEERQAQLQERQAQLREAEREHELQLARIKADQGSASQSGQANPGQTATGTAKPKLPRFDEKHDDMDTFIERF